MLVTDKAQTEWEQKVPTGTPLIIHGAGNLCRSIFKQFPNGVPGHATFCVTDNDPAKIGTCFLGRPVISPQKAVEVYGEVATWVVAVHVGSEDVVEQLSRLGVEKARITHWWSMWQHFPQLKPEAWFDCPEPPSDWLDLWGDDKSKTVVREAYDFFKRYLDRTAPYVPKAAYNLPEHIYFDPEIYLPIPNECFIDCGAYDGDTLQMFVDWCIDPSIVSAVAIEADSDNYAWLRSAWSCKGLIGQLTTVNAALVGDPTVTSISLTGSGVSAKIGRDVLHPRCTPAITLDALLQAAERVTIIKADIEGAELDVLHGAINTIQKHRPVIACCMYHSPSHLWQLVQYLGSICTDYKFYARGYEGNFETVMYAVPAERAIQ